MFIIMAEQAEKFPVRSILRVVIVVVVAVVHRQLAQAFAGELAGAAAAHVRVHFQGLVTVAHFLVALCISENTIQFSGVGSGFVCHTSVRRWA